MPFLFLKTWAENPKQHRRRQESVDKSDDIALGFQLNSHVEVGGSKGMDGWREEVVCRETRRKKHRKYLIYFGLGSEGFFSQALNLSLGTQSRL